MITKHVVFILGAGASCGYGYPTGAQLKAALMGINGDQLYQLQQAGIDEIEAQQFPQQLGKSGINSVDLFLKKNPRFGRTAKYGSPKSYPTQSVRLRAGLGIPRGGSSTFTHVSWTAIASMRLAKTT